MTARLNQYSHALSRPSPTMTADREPRPQQPPAEHNLAHSVLTGRFGITPEQATDLLADPSNTDSPLLLAPVIGAHPVETLWTR
jgi:hypothetical protein